jgi:hypothetical protein
MKIKNYERYTLPNGEVLTGKEILDSIAFKEYMEERFGTNFEKVE